MRQLLASSAVAALLLSGCASTPPLRADRQPLAVTRSDTLPEPTAADATAGERPYLVGPFDKLEVDVFGIDELSKRQVQADAGGRISFPLAGTVDASGKTPAEVARLIATRLRAAHVRDPQVTVNLTEAVSRLVTVDGEVQKPGLYPILGKMTLMRAVATAQGLTEFAKSEYVVVFRTVNGTKYAALYNLAAIRGGYYNDPEIFPDDIVVVSDSRARRLFKDAIAVAPALLTPLVYVLTR